MDSLWRSRGYLPHLDLPQAVQFVTFRLADAIPPSEWERLQGELAALPEDSRSAAERKRIEELLDLGIGSRALSDPANAALVQEALLHGDGERYTLLAWCVMPTHVHVLIEMKTEWPLAKIMHSWKSFTGRRISLSQSGDWRSRGSSQSGDWRSRESRVWQREYWDRWIRDEQHYTSTVRYIEQNPVKAGHVSDPTHWPWSSAHPGTASLQAGSKPGTASLQAGIGSDHTWMLRALRLASLSSGTTWPNPGVGCVLIKNDSVIGEGRTGPSSISPQQHAEAAALADTAQRGHDVRGATAYVTLAPCTTRSTGTTSCSELLIAAGVARVVVGVDDPHQHESESRLNASGIAYESGPCAIEARHLHGGFLRRIVDKRPRFTGKWAMTLDGCLAAHTGKSGWISSPDALALSRRRRRAFDAILIGSGTQQADDPQLLASRPRSRGPLRILVSASATLADDARLLHTVDHAPLLVIHGLAADPARLKAWGAELQAMEDPHDVSQLARTLGAWGLNEVLVEGGATLHGAFLRAGLYDRLELYHGGTTLGGGLPVANGVGAPAIPDGQQWVPECAPRLLGSTILSRWTRTRPG